MKPHHFNEDADGTCELSGKSADHPIHELDAVPLGDAEHDPREDERRDDELTGDVRDFAPPVAMSLTQTVTWIPVSERLPEALAADGRLRRPVSRELRHPLGRTAQAPERPAMNYSARTERACARMAAEQPRRLTFRLLWLLGAALLVLGAALLVLGAVLLGGR